MSKVDHEYFQIRWTMSTDCGNDQRADHGPIRNRVTRIKHQIRQCERRELRKRIRAEARWWGLA